MNELLVSTRNADRGNTVVALATDAARAEGAAKMFEAYLTPLLGAAYRAAFSLTRDREDAEDLVQEAAVQAFRCFDTLQDGARFKGWFFRILTNLFVNGCRQQRRRPAVIRLESTVDPGDLAETPRKGLSAWDMDPAALVEQKLEAEAATAAIAALPAVYRTVAALYFVEELSYLEIAARLGCSIGTIRSRLHRGRKLLQRALGHMVPEEGGGSLTPSLWNEWSAGSLSLPVSPKAAGARR
jgi:RNA polymerase sigma-70 factor (ECF subfamily)